MELVNGIPVFGTTDERTLAQMEAVRARAAAVALMGDNHLGYVMPIGGVAAYRNATSVVGVGFDIGCGVAALRTDLTVETLGDRRRLEELASEIQRTVSFGVGRSNRADDAPVDHPLFAADQWDAIPAHARAGLRARAREQLGTVGSGNHFVDVLADRSGRVWVMTHFGSRGLGHTIASGFLALGQGQKWSARVPETEVIVELDTPLGADYWGAMELAGRYAMVGREWVVTKVAALLGGAGQELVHNWHNFSFRETHDVGRGPESLIVVRKGATPAGPGVRGAIGGSMGDDSVIVRGVEAPAGSEAERLQRSSLMSTVHGAGRVMSRTEAAGKRNRKTGEVLRPGRVTPEMMRDWLEGRGVVLRGGGLDESPHAYRRLSEVLEAQGPTIEVQETLRPLIVVMAGEREFDPYKD